MLWLELDVCLERSGEWSWVLEHLGELEVVPIPGMHCYVEPEPAKPVMQVINVVYLYLLYLNLHAVVIS